MSVVDNFVEVKLPSPDSFLKVRETLTRIGVASKKDKTLYQSCHILHKQGKYYVCHFKELFILDGKAQELSDEDKARRNTIVNLLEEWQLVTIVVPESAQDPIAPLSQIKVLSYKEKDEWTMIAKYSIGKRK